MCFLSENLVEVPSKEMGPTGLLFFLSYLYRIILDLFEEPASPVLGSCLVPELISVLFGSTC